MELFFTVFAIIFIAELPDKTALASLVLATRLPAIPVLLGACTAFTFHAALSVTIGSQLHRLPDFWVHVGSALVFIASAIFMWLRDAEEKDYEIKAPSFWKAAAASCGIIFVAEFGDLTQFAMAAMAARYGQPAIVLSASLLALWSVSALGVFIGAKVKDHLNPKLFQRIAAILFALVGSWLLYQAWAAR